MPKKRSKTLQDRIFWAMVIILVLFLAVLVYKDGRLNSKPEVGESVRIEAGQ